MSKFGLHRGATWKFSVLEIHGQGFSFVLGCVLAKPPGQLDLSVGKDQIPAVKFQIHYKKDSNFNVLTLYLCVQNPTVFRSLQGDLEGNLLAGKLLVQLIVGPSFSL